MIKENKYFTENFMNYDKKMVAVCENKQGEKSIK